VNRYVLAEDGRTPVLAEYYFAWAEWVTADIDRRRVGRDYVGGAIVSTVFLLEDGFGDDTEGRPLLFETQVLGGPLDATITRYGTWERAERGHAQMLARVMQVTGQRPLLDCACGHAAGRHIGIQEDGRLQVFECLVSGCACPEYREGTTEP